MICTAAPPFYLLLWGTIDLILMVGILCGNVLTICAIRINRKLRTVLSNRFVFSLAVSDLLVALTIPYHYFMLLGPELKTNKTLCLIRYMFIVFACSSSVFNLLAIAMDRYIAIIYPLRYTRCMTPQVALLVICCMWGVALAVATVPAYWNLWTGQSVCVISEVLPTGYVNFIVTPMFLLVWCEMFLIYYRIWRKAIDHTKRIRSFQPKTNVTTDRKSISVVLLILGCFSICWLPFLIFLTLRKDSCDFLQPPMWSKIPFRLTMINSFLNPLIYAWKNLNFRSTFRCLLRMNHSEQPTSYYITNYDATKRKTNHANDADVSSQCIDNTNHKSHVELHL